MLVGARWSAIGALTPTYCEDANARPYEPAGPSITRSENEARPSPPVTRERVPRSAPPGPVSETVTVTPPCCLGAPPGSRSWTTSAGLMVTPRTAAAGGADASAREGGAPGFAVAANDTVPTPEMTAVAVLEPGAEPSVQVADARPSPSVTLVGGASDPDATNRKMLRGEWRAQSKLATLMHAVHRPSRQ